MVRQLTKDEQKWLMGLLAVSASIIMVASLEAFMMAKSKEAFEAFMQVQTGGDFTAYINLVLIYYVTNIIEPILISVYALFALPRAGIHFYFRLFFGGMVVLRLVTLFFSMNLGSFFYYLLILLYGLLLVRVVKDPYKAE